MIDNAWKIPIAELTRDRYERIPPVSLAGRNDIWAAIFAPSSRGQGWGLGLSFLRGRKLFQD